MANNGTWSVTPAALADGKYTPTVTATDAAGNTTSGTAESFTVDTSITAPTAQLPANAANDTGVSASDNITSNKTPTLTGTGDAGDTITVVIGGQTLTTTVANNGTWSVTPAALADGKYTPTVTATDAAGNTAIATGESFEVDTKAPTATIAISDTALSMGETSPVTITFSEKVTGLTTSDFNIENGVLSNLTTSDGGKTWTGTLTPTANLEDLTNVISLGAGTYTDLAGNNGTEATSGNYTIDTKAPTVIVTIDGAPVSTSNAVDLNLEVGFSKTVTFKFSEDIGTSFTLQDIQAPVGSMSDLVKVDATTWTAKYTAQTANTTEEIKIANGVVQDLAGNSNVDGADANNAAQIKVLAPIPAKVLNIAISDDNTIGGSANKVYNVSSTSYGSGYLYSGLVSDAVGTAAPTGGLTNDTTPTITVTLDKPLSVNQSIEIVRVVNDPIQGNIQQTVVGTSANMTTTDGKTYTFTDNLPSGAVNADYTYTANVKDATSTVTSTKQAVMTLDTVAETPVVSSYDGVTLKGVLTESGVVFVDSNKNGILDAGESSAIVDAATGTWSLSLTVAERNLISDVNNYEGNGTTPKPGNPMDTYLPLGFVDKAGNTTTETSQVYYFDNSDGTILGDTDLTPADRPQTASGGYVGSRGDTDEDGVQNFEIRFDQDNAGQTILVDKNLTSVGATASDRFNLLLGNGNDVLNVNGAQALNTFVYMEAGDDIYTSGRLYGGANRNNMLVDMGTGNNKIFITGGRQDAVASVTINAKGGDDLLKINGGINNGKINLGDGNNQIIATDDIDGNTLIKMGAGNDLLRISSPGANDRELRGSNIDLGNGNNTVEILSGDVVESTITTGSGNDKLTFAKDIRDPALASGGSVINTGAGNDDVLIKGNVQGSSTVNLGAGDDKVQINGDVNSSTIVGEAGKDTITINGDVIQSTVNAGADNDIITVKGQFNGGDIIAGAGNDVVNLSSVAEALGRQSNVYMGDGNDILNISGNITQDPIIDLGAGNDTINLGGSLSRELIGGLGVDTLNLTSAGQDIDLSNIKGIEVIDISGTGANEINIRASDVLSSDTSTRIFIKGDADDTVDLGRNGKDLREGIIGADSAPWQNTGATVTDADGHTYAVWQHSTNAATQVYIDTDITNII